MKVYAEYFENEKAKFRRKTLLCFGESLKLIGSAILMNPGSAGPIGGLPDCDLINRFFKENHNKIISTDEWKPFSADPTMRQFEKIFSGRYVNDEKPLNGIIQLFNCSYYKEPKLKEAKRHFDKYAGYQFNEHEYLSDKPVYFGWGSVGKQGALSEIAKEVFRRYDLSLTPVYNSDSYLLNGFYHPKYVNLQYSKRDDLKVFLKNFLDVVREKTIA